MPLTEKEQAQFRTVRLIAFAMLVAAPILYLVVGSLLEMQELAEEGTSDMVMYILLIVALAQGGLVKLLQRFQIKTFRKNPRTGSTAAQLYVTLSINTAAMVEAVFLFGLVVFLLTGNIVNMVWFYIIGAVWAVVYWPRREKFERFLQEMKTT